MCSSALRFQTTQIRISSLRAVFLNRRAGINNAGTSSYRKKNLPGRGLTKVENHCLRGEGPCFPLSNRNQEGYATRQQTFVYLVKCNKKRQDISSRTQKAYIHIAQSFSPTHLLLLILVLHIISVKKWLTEYRFCLTLNRHVCNYLVARSNSTT
jgi:hypothetical protein